jgi:hypothetical protein
VPGWRSTCRSRSSAKALWICWLRLGWPD